MIEGLEPVVFVSLMVIEASLSRALYKFEFTVSPVGV